MTCIIATDVCDSRTAVYGNRAFAASDKAENILNPGKSKLARFVLNVLRMRNVNDRKGSVLMEYLVVLVFVGATLAVYSAKSFYSFSGGSSAGDFRKDPPGFGETGRKFTGFYQRTMGGIALPVP